MNVHNKEYNKCTILLVLASHNKTHYELISLFVPVVPAAVRYIYRNEKEIAVVDYLDCIHELAFIVFIRSNRLLDASCSIYITM